MIEDGIWATDDGIYFGYQVKSSDEDALLQAEWQPQATLNRYTGDRHIVTVGPNGSGKTLRLLWPNLMFLRKWSILVVDPKGQLAAMTGPYRAGLTMPDGTKHKVITIDPFGVLPREYPRLVAENDCLRSTGFNPVAALDPDSEDGADEFVDDALGIAQAIMKVPAHEPHWVESAQELVTGLTMLDRLDPDSKGAGGLARVRDQIGWPDQQLAKYIKGELDTYAKDWPEITAKLGRFSEISSDSKELQSILSAARTQTRWLDSRPIKRDLSRGAYNFETMKEVPTTVYLVLPPRRLASHSTWLRLMITEVLQPLMRSVHEAKVPVLFMLDEFAALGHLPVIEDNLALLRGYGVKLWAVFQDLSQAHAIYKERWESVVANAGVLHTFAPQDWFTADYLSKLSGKRLYWTETGGTSTTRTGTWIPSTTKGTSSNWQHFEGPVYWPQALSAMDVGRAVLFSHRAGPSRQTLSFLPWWRDIRELQSFIPAIDRQLAGEQVADHGAGSAAPRRGGKGVPPPPRSHG